MREYREHFVAFLDILGFKQLITHSSCDEIYNIFETIHNNSSDKLIYNGVEIGAYQQIRHMILSDSVILYIPSDIEDSFYALITVCRKLQTTLANRENPILLRGGIAKGNLYCDNGIIYGDGLTNAYLLESNLAKFPRIIFTGDTLEAGKRIAKYVVSDLEFRIEYILDDDMLYMIQIYPVFGRHSVNEIKGYFDGLIRLCNHYINISTDISIREKYVWLRKKIDETIDLIPDIKVKYKAEQEKQMLQSFIESNNREEKNMGEKE